MLQYRYYLALIIIVIFSIFCYFSYIKINDRLRFKKTPQFEFQTITNEIYSYREFKEANRPILMIYFNSECDYCLHEIAEIQRKIELFSSIELVFISSQTTEELCIHFKNSPLLNFKNVKICSCNGLKLYDWFGNLLAPTAIIYSKDGDLIRKFSGATAIDEILKVLNNIK